MTGQNELPHADPNQIAAQPLPTFDSELETTPKPRKPTIAERNHDSIRAQAKIKEPGARLDSAADTTAAPPSNELAGVVYKPPEPAAGPELVG